MSPWRTVWIKGSVSPDELPIIQGWLPRVNDQDWPALQMDIVGIMHGTIDELVSPLQWAAAAAATLFLTVHCTGSYEERDVEATIMVTDGVVNVLPASVPHVRQATFAEQMNRRMASWESSPDAMRPETD